MVEFRNSFVVRSRNYKLVDFADGINENFCSVRNGIWKVKRKANVFEIYHNNYNKHKKVNYKEMEYTNKDYLVGMYDNRFYEKQLILSERISVNNLKTFFFNSNSYEFNYIKNKSNWHCINYYKLKRATKQYNTLESGVIMNVPINSNMKITFGYEHGEIVYIKIAY